MLQHAPDIARQRYEKDRRALDELVDKAGTLDATAGAFPYATGLKILREIGWIFRPYTIARNNGDLRSMDPSVHRQVILECGGRIALHLAGRGEQVKLDTRYEIIGGGDCWHMFREIGPEGRIGAFNEGVLAYVIHKGERANGNHDYTVGCTSEYVADDFDVAAITHGLNKIEQCPPHAGWGFVGSGNLGGSPRLEGSELDPPTLNAQINNILRAQRPAS
jgi:hypothetical protein